MIFDLSAMGEKLVDILESVRQTSGRPVLLVGHEKEREAILQEVGIRLGSAPLNLGIELAEALLAAPEPRFDVASQIANLAKTAGPILVDKIEILFQRTLHIDVVDTLTRVARRRPLLASWPGRLEHSRLRYADRNHPEYLDEDASRVDCHRDLTL